ncbi:tetratricopeptide repeat protein [Streptomyces sp. NBC_01476]|uniref:ATP-binding protein n=1 Tax=Streptomyces sp. NBC_01476 TaxID=2903881 RepID=UPI002E358BB9|nr:tetratricopeptide repeat protein [Streptomyces sp. NBC_01476]
MCQVSAAELAAALSRADPATRRALAELLPTAPDGTEPVSALAGQLAEAAQAGPETRAALRAWLATVPAPGADATAGTSNGVSGAARVTGPVVQARDISGGIHVHEHGRPAKQVLPPRVPRQLIPAPAQLTGRAGDLAALDALRAAATGGGPSLIVVTGAAGVGKTALSATWLRAQAAAYPHGQLYADLRGHSTAGPAGPGEVLGRFLRAFGVGHVPADLPEQTALWRTVTAGLRISLLLDNAFSAAQVRPLLPGSPDALTVVTSRRRLSGLGVDGAAFRLLDVLDPAATVELLARRLGGDRVAREPAAALGLARLCAGLPLAVCVAAARLAARPRQPLAVLAGAMSRESERLATLEAGGEGAVRAALDDTYASLAPATARCYRRLGLAPVTEFGTAVTGAAAGVSPEPAARLLDELVEVNLVEELGPDRHRFHDLIRLHAAQRAAAEETPAGREEAVRRVLDWYLATATGARALLSPTHRRLRRDYARQPQGVPDFPDEASALAWLDAERQHLMTAVRTAAERGWDATAWQTVDSMQPLFLRLRPLDLWIEAHTVGLAAAERAGHTAGVSRMLTTGGSGLSNAGRYDDAVSWFGRALEGARRDSDRRAEAQALHGLGQSHRLAGRLGPATAFFLAALTIREEIGYARGAALTRVCLGDIALAAGRPLAAVRWLARARADLLAVPDPYDAARALAFLGRAHAADGVTDFAVAERELRDALEEFAAAGSVHWQGRVLELLGESAAGRGEPETARDWYERSLAVYLPVSPVDARRLTARLGAQDPGPPQDRGAPPQPR